MYNPFSLKTSIRKRLTYYICIIVLFVVIAFGYAAYFTIETQSATTTQNRLSALTAQISSMFEQFGAIAVQRVKQTGSNTAVQSFLRSGGKDSMNQALQLLTAAETDTLEPVLELYNINGKRMLSTDSSGALNPNADLLTTAEMRTDHVGKLYRLNERIYYPIIAAVVNHNIALGYIVAWRQLISSPQEIASFSKLIGQNGGFNIGSDDGSLWTDGLKLISAPPINIKNLQKIVTYTAPSGNAVVASAKTVPGTRWLILITLSKAVVSKTANDFLLFITIAGIILLITGIVSAWLISRYFITPLQQLTAAAQGMAKGNYAPITVAHKDEIGMLANAFNSMACEVQQAHIALEEKVKERTRELQLTNEDLESFSYSVSHDLRAPLRKTNNYIQLLCNRIIKDDTEITKYLNAIQRNTTGMEQLIDDIFNLARIGNTPLVLQETDMNALVRTVVDEYSSDNDMVEVQIEPLHKVTCDTRLIRQVWINLFSNAIKFSQHAARPCIDISSYKNGNYITYSIKDNGVGFNAEYSEKLFSPFQRLHSKKEFEGTGVGLTIVKRIIEKHNGNVWAESEPGLGAAFYFSLPQL